MMSLKAKNPDRQLEMEEFLRDEERLRQERGSPARYNRLNSGYFVTAIAPGSVQCISCQQDLKLGERITIGKAAASHYTCPK